MGLISPSFDSELALDLLWPVTWEKWWLGCLIGFPDNSLGKESTCNAGDPGSIPGSGKSTGEGIGYQLLYSWASLVAQLVKNLPAVWETWVRKIPWRRKRLPTPVFWPREFHRRYSPWGHKELGTTEWLSTAQPVDRSHFLLCSFLHALERRCIWWDMYSRAPKL